MSLNTTPATFTASEVVTAAKLNTEVRDALTGIQAAWDAFTPSVAGWTLGNGTIVGKYLRVGKTIHFRIKLTAGTTTTTSATLVLGDLPVATHIEWAGALRWVARDVSAAGSFFGDVDLLAAATSLNCRAAEPFVWAAGDFIGVAGTYEGA